jgi:hypothetical protein
MAGHFLDNVFRGGTALHFCEHEQPAPAAFLQSCESGPRKGCEGEEFRQGPDARRAG